MLNKDILRFWSKIPERPIEGCWEWAGFITWNGYGQFFVKEVGKRCNKFAHRVAWELHHGVTIPVGLQIRHSCDNRRCVNPAHLSVGTVQDNTDDRVAKGRHSHGETCSMAILTEAQVEDILHKRRQNISLSRLAAEYGVSLPTVWGISVGRTWKHVFKRVACNVEGTTKA